jgi:crotonobetainyl-CoA:carnitine CoA-transferase CaiB-like acyl-CoA transferase
VRDGTGPYEINDDDTFVMRPIVSQAAAAVASGLSAGELAAYPRFATAAARLEALKAEPKPKRNRVTRKKLRSKP